MVLRSRLLLAPLESVSDCAYRRLCHQQGAGFTWTEMVRADALARRNKSTYGLIDTFDPLTPTGVQLLASKPKQLRAALCHLDALAAEGCPHWARGIQGVDLNFGCPSPDVIGHGAGPAMLKRSARLGELFDTLAEWRAGTALPVGAIGAKIRLGLNGIDEREGVFLSVVELAKGRLDYITLHARHGKDESTVPARWGCIRAAKSAAGDALLILGNGDVFSQADAAEMRRKTGCDGVVVARGAIRTAGLIFDAAWRGDERTLAADAASLAGRYEELRLRFAAREKRYMQASRPRPKYAKYHSEAFRRIRERVLTSAGMGTMSG